MAGINKVILVGHLGSNPRDSGPTRQSRRQ